ncbi:MAG TPA: hypothetical protein VHN36_11265 [Ilumatobacteraceae bacterium]|nr:hypothetical protein [Ilumatobacteraceae bacterium]
MTPTTATPTTVATSTTTTSTTTSINPTTTASRPLGNVCDDVVTAGTQTRAAYADTAFDRFGPLEMAPSLTIRFAHDSTSDPIGVRATRIEGGVLVSASRSPTRPSDPNDRLSVAAVNHDGTTRWSRCLDGNSEIQTAVAAPKYHPANALMVVLTANQPSLRSRIVQLSLATGAEQPIFAAAMSAVGVDADELARLGVADVTDRFALLVDNVAMLGGTYQLMVRYDLVADVAVDVGVPTELSKAEPARACSGGPQPSLLASGDVIVADTTTDVVSRAAASIDPGPVVARWHNGAWSREPAVLAGAVGVRPAFSCDDNLAARVLQGVDAVGKARWTDRQFTHPGADDIGWYLDGDVAVGQVCSRRSGDACDAAKLVGIDPATGAVRWTQPGLRLVAGDPGDGYVLAWAEPTGDVLEPPGWVLLDDRTGREVPGQRWDDPELFTLYPSREAAGFNRTVRAGGLVLVIKDDQVRVWYPSGELGKALFA